jgi:hypothetical protein
MPEDVSSNNLQRLSIPNQYLITEDRNFPERRNIHSVGVEKGVEDEPPLHPWIMDQEFSLLAIF